jgi:hypothetical protein
LKKINLKTQSLFKYKKGPSNGNYALENSSTTASTHNARDLMSVPNVLPLSSAAAASSEEANQ